MPACPICGARELLIANLGLFGYVRHEVFLGDADSMLLAYALVWALIESTASPARITPVTSLWLVAVPLMDTLAVMGRRRWQRRHPFRAERGHPHHLVARIFRSMGKTLLIMLLFMSLLAGLGVVGLSRRVPEHTMVLAALHVFAPYLSFLPSAVVSLANCHR